MIDAEKLLDRFVGNIGPISILVSTSFWSWFDLVPFGPVLPNAADQPASPLVLEASLPVSVLVLLATWHIRSAREALLRPRTFVLCSAALGSTGALAIYGGHTMDIPALIIIGAALAGAYQAVGITVCGSLAMCQGKTNALIHMASCLPFNIVFVLLGLFLRPGASVALCAVLPLISALSFKLYQLRGTNARVITTITLAPAVRSQTVSRKLPVYVLLLVLITASFGLVNCRVSFFGTTGIPSALTDYASLFTRGIVAIVIFVEYVFLSRQPYAMLRTALLFMSAGLLALALAPEAHAALRLAACTLFYAGYAIFDLLIWAVLIIMHRSGRSSAQRFACIVMTLDQLGIFCGTIFGVSMSARGLVPFAMGVTGAVLTLLAAVVLSERNAVKDGLAAPVIEEAQERGPDAPVACRQEGLRHSPTHQATATHAPQPSEPDTVAELANRFFLTEKEASILGYLLAGRSAPYIAEALAVSPNTVKTHIRHIYAKLDVHTRQELLDLV